MLNYLLFAIIVVLLGGFGWYVREQEQVKTKLINAILAKDSQEYVSRTLADNTTIKPEINGDQKSDLIPMDRLTEEEFDNHIAAQAEEVQ